MKTLHKRRPGSSEHLRGSAGLHAPTGSPVAPPHRSLRRSSFSILLESKLGGGVPLTGIKAAPQLAESAGLPHAVCRRKSPATFHVSGAHHHFRLVPSYAGLIYEVVHLVAHSVHVCGLANR